jgi:hypothetical protein
MASASSLLRSADAARKKIRNQQDAYAAFDWENSAQTREDWENYQDYLSKQAVKTSDPSDQLTYQSKIRSARRSFISNELQREQMKIMEGTGTTQTKMDAIHDLFQLAVDNGDANTAQNLISQWDSLSIKLQNEQETAAKSVGAASSKAFTSLVNDLTKGVDDVTLPTGQKVTPLGEIARDLELTGGNENNWKAASDTLEAIRGVIVDRYNNATSQDQIDSLEEKYGAGLVDLDKEINFKIGGKSLTLQDVVNAEANEAMNNPVYSLKAKYNPVSGKNEFTLKENAVDKIDYVRQFDETGQEYFVPLEVRTSQDSLFFGNSDQGRGLGTQITDQGEIIGGNNAGFGQAQKGEIRGGSSEVFRDANQSIEERLKRLGISAKQNGTTLVIQLPGESVERQATIQPDGSIRYMADGGEVIEIGVVDRQLGQEGNDRTFFPAGTPRTVSYEEQSDFGTQSAFGGTLSRASKQGERYIRDITGGSRVEQTFNRNPSDLRLSGTGGPVLRGGINVGNNFSGMGGAVTSSLLQSAQFTRQQNQVEQQRQAMLQMQSQQAARLQSSNVFNLNQTPVQQLTSNGLIKRQLTVAKPTAQPRVYVAPPVATPKITSVGVAKPTGKLTIGTSRGLQPY